MADVVSAVRTYLLADTDITDLIGQRIYLDVLKQNATLPAVLVYKLSERREHKLSGLTGMKITRLAFECHSLLRLTSNAIADAIMECGIDAVKGVTNSVDIRSVQVEAGQRNFYLEDPSGGDDHTYVTAFDLLVHHS